MNFDLNSDYEIDREMLVEFIDESLESLTNINDFMMQLEEDPTNIKVVESIFRPIHSLKGNASYFGMMKTKQLTHDMESILDNIRKGKLYPEKNIISVLLDGMDIVQTILQNRRTDLPELENIQTYDSILERLHQIVVGEHSVEDLWAMLQKNITDLHDNLLSDNHSCSSDINDIQKIIQELVPKQLKTQNAPSSASNLTMLGELKFIMTSTNPGAQSDQIHDLLESMHSDFEDAPSKKILNKTLDSFNTFIETIGFDDLLQGVLEDTIDMLVDLGHDLGNTTCNTPPQVLELNKLLNQSNPEEHIKRIEEILKELLGFFKDEKTLIAIKEAKDTFDTFINTLGYDVLLHQALTGLIDDLMPDENVLPDSVPKVETEVSIESNTEEELIDPSNQQSNNNKETDNKPIKVARTMRVSEDSIDSFLGFVGELIAVDEMFRYIHGQFTQLDVDISCNAELMRVINTFTKLSDELQHSIMEIRKVKVLPLLQKSKRLVRDLSRDLNKEILVHMVGEDIAIDRSLLETLESPLTHIIRNAVDHGIEMPEIRTKARKEPFGNISLTVNETEDEIHFIIEDDGGGINLDAIRQKGIDLGLLSANDQLNQAMLVDLLFTSGVSTADAVTDVSGRGVGMDAVKKNLELIGGTIQVETTSGAGSIFKLMLPKSVGTQILNSFVVKIGDERYIVPLDRVAASFQPQIDDLHRLPDQSFQIKYKDVLYPVLDLKGRCKNDKQHISDGLLIIVEHKHQHFCFFIDEIIGMQKVVLRNVPWLDLDIFSGAAIMGDGKVSMVIDLDQVYEKYRQHQEKESTNEEELQSEPQM